MKDKNRPAWLLPAIFVISLLAVWQVLSGFGIIKSSLFSSPVEILQELYAIHVKDLPQRSILLLHIWTSLRRTFLALILGSAAGILVGLGMGVNTEFYNFFDPVITLIMPIPGIALAPIFIVILGFGDPTIITVGCIAAFFPLAYNTSAGVRNVNPQIIRAARIMGVSNFGLLYKVYLPNAAGHVILGLKLGLARCWRTVIAVEFIAAANFGLGYIIWDAAEYLRAGVVYGGILLLILVYFFLERMFIVFLERNTIQKWGMIQQ